MAQRFTNTNKKSPRFGQHFTVGPGGSHDYKRPGHKKVSIGGKKAPKAPPYDPRAPLTGKQFGQEVKSQVGLKYDPQFAGLDAQQRVSGVQSSQRIPAWYNAYLNDVNAAGARTAAASQAAQTATNTQANAVAGQDAASNATLNAQRQTDAASRGAVVNPNVAQTAQQAVTSRQSQNSAFGALQGTQGAANAAYFQKLGAAGGQGKINALQDEASRSRQIAQQRTALSGEKGQYAAQVKGTLTDRERTWAANQQAFGIKAAQQQTDAAYKAAQVKQQRDALRALTGDKRTKNRLKTIDQKIAAGNLSEKQRHDLATERTALYKALHPSKGKSGGGKTGSGFPSGITPGKARSHQNAFDNAVQAYQGQKDFNKVFGLAQSHRKAPKDLAEAIALRALGRFPSKKTASRLYQKYGVRMKSK